MTQGVVRRKSVFGVFQGMASPSDSWPQTLQHVPYRTFVLDFSKIKVHRRKKKKDINWQVVTEERWIPAFREKMAVTN